MAGWQEDDVEPENEAVVRVKIGSVADSAKAFQSKPKGKKKFIHLVALCHLVTWPL